MDATNIIGLWKAYDQKLTHSLQLNKKLAAEVTWLKVESLLGSMKPIKIFTIVVGVVWVLFVDLLIVGGWGKASPYFLTAAIIQVVLSKLAIGIYIYHLVLINQINIYEPVLATQQKLARLKTTTLWITRLLFLQLPVWTFFYISPSMLQNATWVFYTVQVSVTGLSIAASWWLFRNIRYENRDKKWFRLLFAGKDWQPAIRAMELLRELDDFEKE
jgi:hypothetical protein